MNENYELMEMEQETTEIEEGDYELVEESGDSLNGKVIGLALGAVGLAAAAIAGGVAWAKSKKKKAEDKPKKKRKKLRWVEVEENVVESKEVVEVNEIDEQQ